MLVISFGGAISSRSTASEVDLPPVPSQSPITFVGNEALRWQEPDGSQIWVLKGNVVVRQADLSAHATEVVVWTKSPLPGTDTHRVTTYLEGDVVIQQGKHSPASSRAHLAQRETPNEFRYLARRTLKTWRSEQPAEFLVAGSVTEIAVKPEVWHRASQYRDRMLADVRPAQFLQSQDGATDPVPLFERSAGDETAPETGFQSQPFGPSAPQQALLGPRIVIESRGSQPARLRTVSRPERGDSVLVLDGGVTAQIIDERTGEVVRIGADRVVGWSDRKEGASESPIGGLDANATPQEIYLEGNVDYRQGDRIVQAERMYYNVAGNYGVILRAEFLAPIGELVQGGGAQGYARLKADVLRQIDSSRFVAHGASFTTSRLGVPRYWLQAEELAITQVPKPWSTDVTDQPSLFSSTYTGSATEEVVNSQGNFLYLGGLPVFYWPRFTTDLGHPTYYLESVAFGSDSVFGFQLQTTWDLYQIFGFESRPERTDWNLSVDFLSDRGFGVGSDFRYDDRPVPLLPGTASGVWDVWGIHDDGFDNLGADRRAVPLEEDLRGRLFGRHRQVLAPDTWLNLEVGWISDRNFLEQYFESEWDELKDQTTGLELRRLADDTSWSLAARFRVNDFVTDTDWLPRLDHFTLGRSLLGDRLRWYEHSHVGYGRLQVAEPPSNPIDIEKFDPLAWETPSNGLRAATRQEIDFPLSLGPVKFVPYALGELAFWQEDQLGDSTTRAYGQLGVRSSLSLWRLDRDVQSTLFNLNGLAHKVAFRTDAYWSDANRDFEQFPLYDPLDDDAIEFFRRRFLFDTFGGTFGDNVPDRFDERRYALRRGVQSWVTGPSTEIADDLTAIRMGVRQRWQTKRGRLGEERIIDWITFDVDGTLFPDADRDNFGQEFGLIDYDFRWHVGDRVTLVSDGYLDLFGSGLRMFTLGGFLTRPGQAQFYGGFRNIDGPFQSHLVTGSAQYRLSDKWIVNYSSAVDLGEAGNIGQSAYITRVGESFLATVGFSVDSSRDNVGIRFAIEPRILSRMSRYGTVAGVPVPPVGIDGLE